MSFLRMHLVCSAMVLGACGEGPQADASAHESTPPEADAGTGDSGVDFLFNPLCSAPSLSHEERVELTFDGQEFDFPATPTAELQAESYVGTCPGFDYFSVIRCDLSGRLCVRVFRDYAARDYFETHAAIGKDSAWFAAQLDQQREVTLTRCPAELDGAWISVSFNGTMAQPPYSEANVELTVEAYVPATPCETN